MYSIPGLRALSTYLANMSFKHLLTLCCAALLWVNAQAEPLSACDPAEISVHCGKTPSAAWRGNELWVVFEYEQRLYLSVSRDEGRNYSAPQALIKNAENIETNGENRPKLVIDGSHFYISWTQKTEGRFTGDIRFIHSNNGAVSFSEPRTVNTDGLLTSHRFDDLILTADGSLYVAWLDKRNAHRQREQGGEYSGSAVYYSVSRDHGNTFSDNFKIADHSCECCRLALAPAMNSDSDVAILWRHIFANSTRDHALTTITPTGAVNSVQRATVDDWQIEACPHHGPDLIRAANHQGYHLTWFSNGKRHQGIYYGYFSGEGVKEIHALDQRAGAAHPQLVETSAGILAVWKFFNGEQMQLLAQWKNAQGHWGEVLSLATSEGDTDHPLIIQRGQEPYISWLTAEGYRLMAVRDVAKQGLGSPSSVEEPSAQKITASFTTTNAFKRDSLAEIKARYRGQSFVLSVWSLSCIPCRKDFAVLQNWQTTEPGEDVPLVFISTDAIEDAEEIQGLLSNYDLQAESWAFAESPTALRYAIDPNWYGELPRTYFFDAQHQATAHSGVLKLDWLNAIK